MILLRKKQTSLGLDGTCISAQYLDRVTIASHVTLATFIVAPDLKEHGPAILLYLIDVFEEVSFTISTTSSSWHLTISDPALVDEDERLESLNIETKIVV